MQVEPSTNDVLAANGTKILLKGELKVTFKVTDHEHTVLVAVTEAVDEFILVINLLSEQCCLWDFSPSHILLGEDWYLSGNAGLPMSVGMYKSVRIIVCLRVCRQKYQYPSPYRICGMTQLCG